MRIKLPVQCQQTPTSCHYVVLPSALCVEGQAQCSLSRKSGIGSIQNASRQCTAHVIAASNTWSGNEGSSVEDVGEHDGRVAAGVCERKAVIYGEDSRLRKSSCKRGERC